MSTSPCGLLFVSTGNVTISNACKCALRSLHHCVRLYTYTGSDYNFPVIYFNWSALTLQTALAQNFFHSLNQPVFLVCGNWNRWFVYVWSQLKHLQPLSRNINWRVAVCLLGEKPSPSEYSANTVQYPRNTRHSTELYSTQIQQHNSEKNTPLQVTSVLKIQFEYKCDQQWPHMNPHRALHKFKLSVSNQPHGSN